MYLCAYNLRHRPSYDRAIIWAVIYRREGNRGIYGHTRVALFVHLQQNLSYFPVNARNLPTWKAYKADFGMQGHYLQTQILQIDKRCTALQNLF